MRKLLWLLLVAVLALSALAATPRAYSASDQIAPQVIDTTPLRGQELAIDGTVILYFDQPMDRASVEAAFTTRPVMTGTLQWLDASSVSYKPTRPLERATEYAFVVKDSARSQNGVSMRDSFTLKLRTVGYLDVTQVLPADGSADIEATPTITVIFNRPVVPLLPVEQMGTLPNPLTIEPTADGKGEWLNTSIYTFKPTGLQGGSTYKVTVKKGLTDVTGSILQNDVVVRFSTVAPRVIEIMPSDGSDRHLLDQAVDVTFSQPMNPTAAQAAFSLSSKAGSVAGKFTWNDRNTHLTFTPATRLNYGTFYLINVDHAKALSATGSPLSDDATSSFNTIDTPQIVSVWPQNGDQNARDSGFTVRFSAPMQLKDFASRVTVTPKPGLIFDNYGDDDGFYYTVAFSHEPSTNYTATVDVTGLVDKYGTPLTLDPNSSVYTVVDGKAQVKWSTAAYPPEASLRINGRIGLYSAYNQTTRVFSTHRNITQINLALSSFSLDGFLYLAANPYRDIPFDQTKSLRTWTQTVENPPNILRYDLLTISDQGTSMPPAVISCQGAPPTRLRLGDKVVALPDDPTPLNIRNRAGVSDTRVISRAIVNTQFTVIGGPLCVDNLVWWRLQTSDGKIDGWAAEGDASHYFIGRQGSTGAVLPPTAQPTPQKQPPTQAAAAPLKPGFYMLNFDSPELPGRDVTHVMVVATANITLKVTEYTALAWVTDLKTGQPLPGLTVQFYRPASSTRDNPLPPVKIGTAQTDENGLALLKLSDRLSTLWTNVYAVVQDGTNLGVGFLGWDDGISPWDFNQPDDFYRQNVTVYLYSDRSLYRPGQPVYFRGVLRDRNDVTYTLSNLKTVFVEAIDDQGQSIYTKEVPVTPYGTFADSFTISEDAALGYYRIVVQTDPANEKGPTFTRGINVAQYRVPEFQVNVNAEKPEVVQGDKIKVNVESSFFFGGAVSNAQVEWSVFSDSYYFNYKGTGYYDFVDFNWDEGFRETGTYGNQVADGKGKTDAKGLFTIEVPADLGKEKQSQTFTVEARVIDENDQLIAGRVQVIVHQGEFYIGAGPQEYVGTATKPQTINLLTANWDSSPMPNIPLSVRVVERVWTSVQTVEPATGRTVWNYDVKENPVADGEVQTNGDGKAVYAFTPPKGGVYKIYATSRDTRGNQITTSTFMWVAGPNYVPWRQQNSNRIDLKIDRDSYKVGDTASILVASPFQGETKALITVERGSILKTEVVTMPNNSYVYHLPITADMAPNAFVSVMIVKGVDATNPVAAFRMGMVGLGVETERLKLNIEITPDKPQAGPRETVNYKVRVTDFEGKPVRAEVGAGLTDLAVLSLLPDTSTPILQHFYEKQGLGVRTSSALTISVDQTTQEILNTVKGGGGGGPEGGIFEVRQRFVDTPLWKPDVVTDDNGEATVTVTLPDNLTTWRLDVRAVTLPAGETKTTLVGQNTFDLISTKPLLIRPLTPRFYVVGDTSSLIAIVNNNTGADQDVTAKVDVKGATLTGNAEQTGKIPSLGRARFEWPIEVQDVDNVDVTFYASTADGKFTDAAKSAVGQGENKTLPVVRYEAPETVGTAGTLGPSDGTRTEGISLPRRFNVTQGTLDVRLDRSLAAGTVDALNVLKYYPYYCTEQTISRFLPNLSTYGAFTKLGIDNPALREDVSKALSDAIQRLYADQKVDGGWGWFYRDTSDPVVTAYAVIGLAEARLQKFTIDDQVFANAIRYLRDQLMTPGPQASTWQLNRQAFLLYALARADSGDFSRAARLFEIREKMSIYARAYLAMTFNLIDPKITTYTDPLMSDLQNRAIASATGMHWEEDYGDYINWNTDTRTTAIALKALIQIQPDNQLIPNVVRWLMIARKADSWETTQETAWAVMALVDWMQHTGELKPNYTFGAILNDKTLVSGEKANPDNVRETVKLKISVADLLKGQVNRLDINRSSGDGMLYYTAHLTAYLSADQVEALSRGLSLSRTYSLVGDPDHKSITEAHVGDNIQVTLTIVVPNDLHYVVITDPIPAGTEPIDPGLATSGTVGEPPNLKMDNPFWEGWGWWWFSQTEIRDDKVVLYATYLPQGTYRYTYTLRAGMAGQYHVIPTTGQEFYFPEVYGRSDGMLFTLKPALPGANDPTNPTETPTPKP